MWWAKVRENKRRGATRGSLASGTDLFEGLLDLLKGVAVLHPRDALEAAVFVDGALEGTAGGAVDVVPEGHRVLGRFGVRDAPKAQVTAVDLQLASPARGPSGLGGLDDVRLVVAHGGQAATGVA